LALRGTDFAVIDIFYCSWPFLLVQVDVLDSENKIPFECDHCVRMPKRKAMFMLEMISELPTCPEITDSIPIA
jgi:hypothetical protein